MTQTLQQIKEALLMGKHSDAGCVGCGRTRLRNRKCALKC